ncbi:MAG: YceI family protein [Bacteroidetes bacterium]|nr:YceI family protein [Bacteroidota bacterium]
MKLSIKALLPLFAVLFLVACSSTPEGEKVEAGEEQEAAQASSGTTYMVNTADSKVHWLASKVSAQHPGTVKLNSGKFTVENGNITAGKFAMDMTSITVNDPNMNEEKTANLTGHLKSEDFFLVEQYPTATFEVVSCTPVEGEPEATHRINGNLKIKDVTKSINFPANVVISETMVQAVSPQFTINRQEWGITYPGMPDDLINDMIGLRLEIYAAPVEMQ